MEHFYQPTEATRTRTILNPQAQQGHLHLNASGGTTPHGEPARAGRAERSDGDARPDRRRGCSPSIRASTATTGHASRRPRTPSTRSASCIRRPRHAQRVRARPARLDFNLTRRAPPDRHVLLAAVPQQPGHPEQLPNRSFPGPTSTNYGIQASYRTTGSLGLRSTLGRTWSTRSRAAGSGRRSTSSATSPATCSPTRASSPWTSDGNVNNTEFSNLSSVAAANEPAAAQHDELEHRQHAELDQGHAQLVVRRGVHADHPRSEQRQPRPVDHVRGRHDQRSGANDVHDDELPERVNGAARDARAISTRSSPARHRDQRHRAPERGPASTSTWAT